MEQIPSGTSVSTNPDTEVSGTPSTNSQAPLIRSKKGRPVLTAEERAKVLSKFAAYASGPEVLQYIQESFGKTLALNNIYAIKYAPANQALLKRLREKFEADVVLVEFASKRRRIEEAEDLFRINKRKGKYAMALKCLEHIQNELEGKQGNSFNLAITQYNEYSTWSDDEIRAKLEENRKLLLQKGKVIHASRIRETEENDGDCGTSPGETLQGE